MVHLPLIPQALIDKWCTPAGFLPDIPRPRGLNIHIPPSSCPFPFASHSPIKMDEADLAALIEDGERLCVFLFAFRVPGPMNLSRLRVKVVFGSPTCPETGWRLIHMQPHTVVYHCRELRMDIRLLIDPWRRGPLLLCFSAEVPGSDCCADKVRLVRKKIMG